MTLCHNRGRSETEGASERKSLKKIQFMSRHIEALWWSHLACWRWDHNAAIHSSS